MDNSKDNNGSTVELIHYLHIDENTIQIGVYSQKTKSYYMGKIKIDK